MADAATSAGLDFIVSTDHNTNSANRAWAAAESDGLEVIAGEEVTTRHGHWLAIALPPGGWVDWRYAPRDGVFATYAETGPGGRRPGGGRASVGAASGMRMGVRLPRRGRDGSLERVVERR